MRRKTCLLYVVSKIKKILYLFVFMINLFALGSVDAMAGIWTTIDVPGEYGAWPTMASDIDGDNIVGSYGFGHSFLYNGTSWTTLDMPGAFWTEAHGIDGSNIVGTYGDASGGQHGFFYNGSSWTTLDMPGADATSACGIDGGNIVGSYTDGFGHSCSFLYDWANWTTLDVPLTFSATDIDGDNILLSDGAISFLYNGTTLTELIMPDTHGTVASSIDGSNIVGCYWGGDGVRHGFLYNGSSWTTLDMPGASQTAACGIDGSNIVGQYFDASDAYHGFVYAIPEPGTVFLLGLGGLVLVRRRRG